MLESLSASQLNSIIEFVLRANGPEMEDAVRGRLQVDDTIATGKGLDSIDSSVEDRTLSILGEDYLLKVDEGQPAGTVADINSLMEWVDARSLAPPESVESYAYGIQQAIYKRGTIKRFGYEGTGFIDYILEQYMPKIANDLELKIAQELERAISDNINKGNK